jgi:hypothetical protein
MSLAWWRIESNAGTLLFYRSEDFVGTRTLLPPSGSEAASGSGGIGAGIIAIAIGAVGGVVLVAVAVLAVVYLRKRSTHLGDQRERISDTGSPPDTLHTTILDLDELGINPSSPTSSYATTWKQWSKVVDD